MPNTDLPDEELHLTEDEPPQEEPLLDRRTAIAQARAIRREAAALEQSEKEKAAETANSILELAAPEPPKRSIRRQMAPIPITVPTGRFSWLNDFKKLAPAQSDAEEIVEKLVAESLQRDEEPDPEESAETRPVETADLLEHIITEVQNPHAPEAIVAQVLRESAAAPQELPAEPEEEPADETTEITEPETASAAEETGYADEPETEPEESDAAEAEDEVEEPEEEPAPPPVRRRMPVHIPTCSDEEAAAQYRAAVREGRAALKKQVHSSNRAWSREAAGIRARMTGEKTARQTAKWNIGICLTILFAVALGMLILERPTVSMEENRTLAKMPEFSMEDYLSGSYTAGVAEYYNDTVPGRSTLKGWVQKIRKCMGMPSEVALHGSGAVQQPVTEAATTEPPAETTAPQVTAVTLLNLEEETFTETTAAPEPEAPEREGEISNNILIVNKRGIMLFGGGETLGEGYIRNVNRFKESLP
ncbi:MAG: hypothetical protein J5722_12665, partial [Oscillospiraceae bacterium]|nr:hypothetical protein [Oscillospiraceae bacterium]